MAFVAMTERPELTEVAAYRLTVDADGNITSARPIERAPSHLVGVWDYGTVPVGQYCLIPIGETVTLDLSDVPVEPFVSTVSDVEIDENDPETIGRRYENYG